MVTALLLNGAKEIKIYGRNKEKLLNFKKSIELTLVEATLKVASTTTIIDTDLINNIDLSNTFMLVNTTPLGMYPNVDKCPTEKKDLQKLSKDALVYDIIYNPPETKLLKDAKSLGLNTINGVEMLVRQGAASLNIWLEKDVAPLEIMRNAVVETLR